MKQKKRCVWLEVDLLVCLEGENEEKKGKKRGGGVGGGGKRRLARTRKCALVDGALKEWSKTAPSELVDRGCSIT